MKKGGYKNYCKSIREEWKKKGEKVPVPEQGKRLCVTRPSTAPRLNVNPPLSITSAHLIFRIPRPLLSGAGWKALSDSEKDALMD